MLLVLWFQALILLSGPSTWQLWMSVQKSERWSGKTSKPRVLSSVSATKLSGNLGQVPPLGTSVCSSVKWAVPLCYVISKGLSSWACYCLVPSLYFIIWTSTAGMVFAQVGISLLSMHCRYWRGLRKAVFLLLICFVSLLLTEKSPWWQYNSWNA